MIAPKHTKPIIVIIGPTATNKTRVSMELAKKFNGEIINADAFQVYREMQVGVNKPTTQEMQTNKFHLIGCVSINDKWDIKQFQKMANDIIQDIYARHKLPILVGGSHLYVDALINNYDLDKSAERDARFNDWTTEALLSKLKAHNLELANKIGNNHKRLVRALQIMSDGLSMHQRKASFYDPLYIFCNKPRVQLYQDINTRVDQMLQHGWIDEVKKIMVQYPNYAELNAFKAIGYSEIAQGINNPPINIDKIKQRTRQYAKRQLTWIRHHYLDVCEYIQNNLDDVCKHVACWLKK